MGGAAAVVDETAGAGALCPAAATCQNTVGSYVCRCSYGFYADSGSGGACESQSVRLSVFSRRVSVIADSQ